MKLKKRPIGKVMSALQLQSRAENLFIELIPESVTPPAIFIQTSLQLKYRGASLNLSPGFYAEEFRRLLQIVKEVI